MLLDISEVVVVRLLQYLLYFVDLRLVRDKFSCNPRILDETALDLVSHFLSCSRGLGLLLLAAVK